MQESNLIFDIKQPQNGCFFEFFFSIIKLEGEYYDQIKRCI